MQRPSRVFGPVPSRRLGRSLGVDLVPHKVCTLDCVYCQVGATTQATLERKAWVPTDEVLADLRARLDEVRPDAVTFSGCGEPTLHSDLGRIIDEVRELSSAPVCLLTNGTLFFRPEVRQEAARADIVMPSLDAADEETFRAVNRPHPGLVLADVLEGLRRFRDAFDGSLRLEVFLVAGLNDSPASLEALAAAAASLRPDRVELNTSVRAPRPQDAPPLTRAQMEAALPLFGPRAEIIASFRPPESAGAGRAGLAEVEELLRRRACSAPDVAHGLGLAPGRARELLDELLRRGRVGRVEQAGETYYRYRSGEDRE